jgi:hypothetical protein
MINVALPRGWTRVNDRCIAMPNRKGGVQKYRYTVVQIGAGEAAQFEAFSMGQILAEKLSTAEEAIEACRRHHRSAKK